MTAVTSQISYNLGEEVRISFIFRNNGNEAITLSTYPPEILIAATSLKPYKTIPGGDGITLPPGEFVEYIAIWDQLDNEGMQIPAGDYVIQMLDIELGEGKGILSLAESPRVTITGNQTQTR